MEIKNGENRSSKVWQRSERSELESESRSVGTFPAVSAEYGSYQVRTGREDSNKSDTFISGEQSIGEISGKIISQLINETEKQLAYHEEQAEVLRERIQELKQFSEVSTAITESQ
jgi:hypothetical protein